MRVGAQGMGECLDDVLERLEARPVREDVDDALGSARKRVRARHVSGVRRKRRPGR